MKEKRPRWRTGAILVVVGSVLAALVGSTAAAKPVARHAASTLNLAFANGYEGEPAFTQQTNSVVSAAKKLGIPLQVYQNNGSAQTALSNVSLMANASTKPDVIIDYNPVANSAQRLGDALKATGIPCIAVNTPIPNCAYFNENVARLANQLAHVMVPLMKKRGWTAKNTVIAIYQLSALGSLNSAVTDFYADMSHLLPGMTPISASQITPATTTIQGGQGIQVDSDGTQPASYTAFLRALQSIPRNKHIVMSCIGDDEALAVYHALESQGRLKDAMISGYSAYPQAIHLMRTTSTWVADSANFFTYWGEFLVPMAYAMAHGATPPAQTTPPQGIITQQNVNTYFDAKGVIKVFPPLGPEDAYLVKTGLLQKFNNIAGLMK